ncbi:MAG: hypothetical protein ACRD1H_20330 [Vicinamibacterales bacterium]
MTEMNAAHFIYIPVCILIGVVFGWILGGRAARDAYLTELGRREERRTKNEERRTTTKNGER